MEYGDVPGVSRHEHLSKPEMVQMAELMGADEAEVYTKNPGGVEVRVRGMNIEQRQDLLYQLENHGAAGVTYDVVPMDERDFDVMRRTEYDGHEIVVTEGQRIYVDDHDITEEYRGSPISESLLYDVKHRIAAGNLPPDEEEPPLTDRELLQAISCLPDGWEPGDDIEFADVDWETLKPIADEHGGMQGVIEAVKASTIEAPDSGSESVEQSDDPTDSDEDEAAESDRERADGDAVDAAKDAYVRGDIGVLELEERLEDAIELPAALAQTV
jgi:hypothetical protein